MEGCDHLQESQSPQKRLIDQLICVGRLHRTVLEKELNKTGVYRSQHYLLMYIADNPNVSQKEIARLHHVSAATVAVSLKKLECGGYIRRVVDQQDNRYNQICITEKGREVVEKSIRYFQKLENHIFEGFSMEEMEELLEYLERMSRNLEKFLPEAESKEV